MGDRISGEHPALAGGKDVTADTQTSPLAITLESGDSDEGANRQDPGAEHTERGGGSEIARTTATTIQASPPSSQVAGLGSHGVAMCACGGYNVQKD